MRLISSNPKFKTKKRTSSGAYATRSAATGRFVTVTEAKRFPATSPHAFSNTTVEVTPKRPVDAKRLKAMIRASSGPWRRNNVVIHGTDGAIVVAVRPVEVETFTSAALGAADEMVQVEQTQIDLYKSKVLDRVRFRFSTPEAAETWFENGRVPGYGDKTPLQMVAAGHAARLIEAINAIEAGVHA